MFLDCNLLNGDLRVSQYFHSDSELNKFGINNILSKNFTIIGENQWFSFIKMKKLKQISGARFLKIKSQNLLEVHCVVISLSCIIVVKVN